MMSKQLPKETLPCQPLIYSTASALLPSQSQMNHTQHKKLVENIKPSNGAIVSKSGAQMLSINMRQTSYSQPQSVSRVCEPTYAQLNHSTKNSASGVVTSQPKRHSVPVEQSFINDCYQNVVEANKLNPQPTDQSHCNKENGVMVRESHLQSFDMCPLHCSVITLCISLLMAPYSICCSICGILNSVFAYVEHRHGNVREYRRLQKKSRCCTGIALSAALLLPTITIILIKLILGKWVWEMIAMTVRLKLESNVLAPTTPPLKLHLRT